MWQYNYQGVDNNSDELMHWKYIKRYKSNGKWRYVYANKETHDSITTARRRSRIDRDIADSYVKGIYNDVNSPGYKISKDNTRGTGAAIKLQADNAQYHLDLAKKNKEKANITIFKNSISELNRLSIIKAKRWIANLLKRE